MSEPIAQGAQQPVDLSNVASAFIQKQGDALASVELLLKENYDLRNKNAGLRDSLNEVKGQLPKEGQQVLDLESVEKFNAYRELGELDDLKKLFADYESATQELSSIKTDLTVRQVAGKLGLQYDVLTRLLKADNVGLVVEGDDIKVKVKDDTFVPFEDYEKQNWEHFESVLHGKPNTFVSQGSAKQKTGSASSSLVNQFLEKNKERAAINPFGG